jgi:hypothetical protein
MRRARRGRAIGNHRAEGPRTGRLKPDREAYNHNHAIKGRRFLDVATKAKGSAQYDLQFIARMELAT